MMKYTVFKMLRIIQTDFTLISEVDDYNNIRFQKKLYGVGSFELTLNYINTDFVKGRLILFENCVGIIKEIGHEWGRNKKTVVKGFELKGLLQQRITIPPNGNATHAFYTEPVESIMKPLVQRNCIDIANMAFSDFEVATDNRQGTSYTFESRYKNLAIELENLGKMAGMGWKIDLDTTNQKYIFDIIQGTNRSSSVFFSQKYNNIETETYTNSDINAINYAIVGGQGAGAARTIEEVGAATGFDKVVAFVDARDIDDSDSLISRGTQKIAEQATIESFFATVLDAPFVFEEDFFLGDIVTYINEEIALTKQIRIEEVTIFHTKEKGITKQYNFGGSVKTIKQLLDTYTDTPID